jgi:hypothetical protein
MPQLPSEPVPTVPQLQGGTRREIAKVLKLQREYQQQHSENPTIGTSLGIADAVAEEVFILHEGDIKDAYD